MRAFRQMVVVLVCLAATAVGLGEPYWVSYEANAGFPEDEGWHRSAFYGGAQRSLEDGALVIDSRDSIMISDSYDQSRPGNLDPNIQESLIVQWRLLIEAVQGPYDPVVGLFSDDRTAVNLAFSYNRIKAVGGAGWIVTFEPGVFHDYELRSADMRTYDLYVDNVLAYTGDFWSPSVDASRVIWGDDVEGGASLARWDYFRYGVIAPESCTVWLVLVVALVRYPTARTRRL